MCIKKSSQYIRQTLIENKNCKKPGREDKKIKNVNKKTKKKTKEEKRNQNPAAAVKETTAQ